MYIVARNTIAETHEDIIKCILEEGDAIVTEDNEATLEVHNLHTHIVYPLAQPMQHPASPYGDNFLREYVKKVMEITPWKGDGTDAVYTYGNRIRDFEQNDIPSGMGHGLDQLSLVIARLQKSPITRRAVICTWNPGTDLFVHDPPCIDIIQFIIRKGKLNLTAYIRSNDMLMAWGANCYALAHMLDYVAKQCGVEPGWIETNSMSAHIYYMRDKPDLDRFKMHIFRAMR